MPISPLGSFPSSLPLSLSHQTHIAKREEEENKKRKMSRNTSSCTNNNVSIVGSVSGPCGACKFLRRKCVRDCIFAPYFDSESGSHFAAVHKVFGASNVSKLLLRIPAHKRLDAVVTICYEAQARIRDPVYGCVSHIFSLQQQVVDLQAELEFVQTHLATLELPPHEAARRLASIPNSSHLAPTSSLSANITNIQQLQPLPEQENRRCLPPESSHSLDNEFQTLAQEFLSIYFPGVRLPPSKSC